MAEAVKPKKKNKSKHSAKNKQSCAEQETETPTVFSYDTTTKNEVEKDIPDELSDKNNEAVASLKKNMEMEDPGGGESGVKDMDQPACRNMVDGCENQTVSTLEVEEPQQKHKVPDLDEGQNILTSTDASASSEILPTGEIGIVNMKHGCLEATASPSVGKPTSKTMVKSASHVKESPLTPEVKPLYPRLEEQAVVAAQLAIQPFTVEQLHSLYYNPMLEQREEFVDNFLKQVNQDRHEFYELLLNYYRARNRLVAAEQDTDILQKDYHNYQELVWSLMENKMTIQGLCADKSKVSGDIQFSTAVYNEDQLQDMIQTLKKICNHISDSMSLHAYEAQLSRLQVKSYLYRLYEEHPAFRGLPPNAPPVAFLPQQRDPAVSRQVEALKTCISILFMHCRRPGKDATFVEDLHKWLSMLVATLLRLATFEDHLFLVNHLLRCPGGVNKWGTKFVQVVPPRWEPTEGTTSGWGSPFLDHIITMLANTLHPIRMREDLLYQMKVSMSPPADKADQNPWIMVDSDGEEDEDPENSWHCLHENDVVALLNQVPLNYVFRYVLLIHSQADGNEVYDVRHTSEAGFLKLCAFVRCLIELFDQGLQHYRMGRYRQLNKRLGKMIRHVVCFVCDHWENYRTAFPLMQLSIRERLQLEVDMVFQHAVASILSAQRLGSWQFLADLPFRAVSLPMMWRLVWVMHEGCEGLTGKWTAPGLSPTLEECQQQLSCPDNQQAFEDKLVQMPTSEAIFLLTTFANMAQSCHSEETAFIRAVTGEIYQIAYIRCHTRELCSKQGRELLAAICVNHPFVMSDLLHTTHNTMDKIGMVSLYLYRELPLHLWSPTQADIAVLQLWLLQHELHSAHNQLARLITDKMNWGYNTKADALFLPLALHRQMAVLVVEAYMAHLSGKEVGGLMTEGWRQVAALMRTQQTEEQLLANWAWQLAQRMCLHSQMQPRPVLGSPAAQQHSEHEIIIPNLTTDLQYQPIMTAITKNFSLASFLALVMSKYSHNVADFCSEGLKQLSGLVAKLHYVPTIRVLYYVTPLFYNQPQYLTSNETFNKILHLLLIADNSKKGFFHTEFPGLVTKLLCAMIQSQVQLECVPGGRGGLAVVLFWLKVLTSQAAWQQDRNVLFVIDLLVEVSFRIPGALNSVLKFFEKINKDLLHQEKEQGLFSSLVTWLASGKTLPSLIEANHAAEVAYYSYAVLDVESSWQEDYGLLSQLQLVLADDNIAVETALAAIVAKSGQQAAPSLDRLVIYRWAQLALNMDVQHPLLPVVWQRFFMYYLGRQTAPSGHPNLSGVGERFFTSTGNVSLMKKMKHRLEETAEKYNVQATKEQSRDAALAGTGGDVDSLCDSYTEGGSLLDHDNVQAGRHHSLRLVKFYETLSFWLDEPRLHDASLYLPALPPQYQADRLLSLFQNEKTLWLDFVSWDKIDSCLRELTNYWVSEMMHDACHENEIDLKTDEQRKTATERILSRLHRQPQPQSPPPLDQVRSAVPDLTPAMLLDKKSLLFALRSDLSTLVEYAKVYSLQLSRHVGLNCGYSELLPCLYTNETTESQVTVECRSTFNPITHRCKGAAVLVARHDAAKRNDIVLRKMEENRVEYNQLVIESMLPPPQNVCSSAVHVENTIIQLIKLRQNCGDHNSRDKLTEVGTAMFYYLTTFITDETKYYPPTCQFFSACVEQLGQVFIRGNPAQSQPLLQAILQSPALAGQLSPNFSPNASPQFFLSMYEDLMQVPYRQGVDVALTLLTKFDVPAWLGNCPVFSQRAALLEVIVGILCRFGKEPSDDMKVLFQIYHMHLKLLIAYRFPEHYMDIIKLLVKVSSADQLCVDVWHDYVKQLGFLAQTPPSSPSQPCPQDLLYTLLPLTQIRESLGWLASHFLRLRTGDVDLSRFGLYPRWRDYVPHLATLQGGLLAQHIHITASNCKAGHLDTNTALVELWELITAVYLPWLQPLNTDEVMSPWIQSDSQVAMVVIGSWVQSISCLHQSWMELQAPGRGRVLGHMWKYYHQHIGRVETPKHVLAAIHDQLVTLPWSDFWPDFDDTRTMVQLLDQPHQRSCKEFLGNIFSMFPWKQVAQQFVKQESVESAIKLHVHLFQLMVELAAETIILENTGLANLISSSDSFQWFMVDGVSYRNVTSWFLSKSDPKCVLAERTSKSASIIRLLRNVAEFHLLPEGGSSHSEACIKWCVYVGVVVGLVARCSHLQDVKPDAFHLILANLLTEVETVVGATVDATEQQQQAVALCTQVLGVLNQCNPQGPTTTILTSTLLDWIESSATSPLLLPLVAASSRSVASVSHMVALLEGCIEAYFSVDVITREACGWTLLLAALTPPQLGKDVYIEESLKQGCYLTLFAQVLQILPLSSSISEEHSTLDELVMWFGKVKPGAHNEGKLMLWMGKVVELCLRQLIYGGTMQQVAMTLKKFVPILMTLAEDKSSAGLLGAIGLGRRTQLTLRFRVITKALATYLAAQVLTNNSVRVAPNAPGYVTLASATSPRRRSSSSSEPGPEPLALQGLNHLEALKTNKAYVAHKDDLTYITTFICDPSHSVHDSPALFTTLLCQLYPDINYLAILRYALPPPAYSDAMLHSPGGTYM